MHGVGYRPVNVLVVLVVYDGTCMLLIQAAVCGDIIVIAQVCDLPSVSEHF